MACGYRERRKILGAFAFWAERALYGSQTLTAFCKYTFINRVNTRLYCYSLLKMLAIYRTLVVTVCLRAPESPCSMQLNMVSKYHDNLK